MGKLLIDIGALTATKQIANAKAKLIVDGFVAAQGGPVTGTEQEKMDWFIERISEYVLDLRTAAKVEIKADKLAALEIKSVRRPMGPGFVTPEHIEHVAERVKGAAPKIELDHRDAKGLMGEG